MNGLFWPLIATFFVSIISFFGVMVLILKQKVLDKILLLLVGFSAGAMLGGAMLHIIPELVFDDHKHESLAWTGFDENIFLFVLCGFSVFFLLERFLHWHHDHKNKGQCRRIKTLSYMNLVGDGLHNFIDGVLIAVGFSVSFEIGIATTIAVIAHEIPQEISDFGVLIYGGFGKLKALLWNFVSALMAVVGAIVGYALIFRFDSIQVFLLAVTAGGFIYIAASDLIPEINKEKNVWKSILSFIFFLLGLIFMYLIKHFLEG